MFLQSTMGMFVFLICPLAGVLAWDILKRRKADRLRRERWENEEALEYGENRDTSETGMFTVFRGILERRTEKEPRRRDRESRWRESEPYGPVERRAEEAAEETAKETARKIAKETARETAKEIAKETAKEIAQEKAQKIVQEKAQERSGRRMAESASRYRERELRELYSEEEEIPRPSHRRAPVPARERLGEFYQPVESYEPWEQVAAMERSERGRRSRLDRDDEFYYYSQLDDDLDYYQELEEAAEHYRKMKESLKRYKRMEAVMNRCRRLEEELSRYEALADRLEAFERTNLYGRPNRHAGTTGNGVSDRGARQEPPVDHIDRPGGMTPPRNE